MLTPTDKLSIAAAKLSRSAPLEWTPFLEALREYQIETMKNCISSPLPLLPRNQGHAQAVAHLLELMEKCVTRAEKTERRQK